MENNRCHTIYSSSLFDIYNIHNKKPGKDKPTGWLNDYYINLPQKGYYSYYHPKESYTVYNGVVHLQNRHTETRVLKDSTELIETSIKLKETVIEQFKGKYFYNSSSHYTENESFRFPIDTISGNSRTDYLHSLLYMDASDSQWNDKLATDEIIIDLLNVIFNKLNVSDIYSTLSQKELDKHLYIIERAKGFILANFMDDIELSDIASHAYSSPFHFSRIFKLFTSRSPYQYLIKVRLNHAIQLLLNTKDPVTQISFKSGFNSLNHFIATFSNWYGISPLQYRKQHH